MNKLMIEIPDDLNASLLHLSDEQKKPVNLIVDESIRRYVALEKFRTIRKQALPFAEAQGYVTDEDIFEAIS